MKLLLVVLFVPWGVHDFPLRVTRVCLEGPQDLYLRNLTGFVISAHLAEQPFHVVARKVYQDMVHRPTGLLWASISVHYIYIDITCDIVYSYRIIDAILKRLCGESVGMHLDNAKA